MGNEILDLPEGPKKSYRSILLLASAVASYGAFWLFSVMSWPYSQIFVLITAVFLIVYVLERFVNDSEKSLLDYWIFLNVLIFILALTLRSLSRPHGNFVLFIFIISAGLMFLYYAYQKNRQGRGK